MRILLLCSILIVAFTYSTKAQNNNDKRIVALEPQLQKILSDWKVVGYAVAIVDKNGIIYSKGFGYRDYDKKLPVTPNTLFAIGSCTKAFTASIIGMLDKEKKIELDKPVHTYLPNLQFYNAGMTDNITLRDMMSHRTGLPRHDISWYLFTTSSRDSILQRIQYQEPSAGIKDKWQYNNFMYFLQGVLAEKLSGKSWEENVRSSILKPLGMTRTNFDISDLQKDNDASLGYQVKKDSVIKKMNYYTINSMGPAGSINSSVTEMANWVRTWINGGKFNNKEIIPENFTREAISSQMIIAPGLPEKESPDVFLSNYGFGWFLASYRGHYRVEHGGNINGFSASTSFYPTDSIGIIVLTNQNGSAVPSIVRNLVTDRILNLPYKDWSSELKKQVDKQKKTAQDVKKSTNSNQKKGTTPSHPLNDYTGTYVNGGYGAMDLFAKGDSLFFRSPGKLTWLKHYHYDIFQPYEVDPEEGIDTTDTDANPLFIQFNTGINGDIKSISANLETSLKPIEFKRKEKEVATTASELKKYEGDYEIGGTITKVYTKGNTLYLFVPGQPDYELAPLGNNKFRLKGIEGYSLEFINNDNNQITAVSFIQPNGTFKAAKK
ncbi:MAG: serine hydrolase [Candidatus Dadabacteria bacterium]